MQISNCFRDINIKNEEFVFHRITLLMVHTRSSSVRKNIFNLSKKKLEQQQSTIC